MITSRYYDIDETLESIWEGVLNFDHLSWEASRECEIINNLRPQKGISEDLLRETFFSMTNSESSIKDTVSQELLDTRSVLQRATQLPEFTSLRHSTEGDDTASIIAVGVFFKELFDNLPEEIINELENVKKAKEEMQSLSTLSKLQEEQDMNTTFQEQGESARRLSQEQVESACRLFEESLDKLESSMQEKADGFTFAMASSSKKAQDKLEEVSKLKESLSWGSENSGSSIQLGEIDTLLDLSKYLKENDFSSLIDMLGSFERMAASIIESNLNGRDELVSYELAPLDFDGLAPNEMIAFADEPDGPLMIDILSRLDSVLKYRYEGKEPTAKGPLVFVEDVSGSTMGQTFSFLSAINFTLIKSSALQNREYINIPFSGPGQFSVYRPGHNPDIKEVLSHLDSGYFGGTEPYAPLNEAIEIIENDPSMKKAFILFGTDGSIPPAPDDFISKIDNLKNKRGLEIYAILIGHNLASVSFANKTIKLYASLSVDKSLFEILEPLL